MGLKPMVQHLLVPHSVEHYLKFRPIYPAAIYNKLLKNAFKIHVILDLGSGPGHSIRSMLRAGVKAQWFARDPDPQMIQALRAQGDLQEIDAKVGGAESIELPSASVDLVSVGSAFHWMKQEGASREILRVLRRPGWIHVYEYQFPKARALPKLNEWIRRQFNERWKFENQTPRGTLKELLAPLLAQPGVRMDEELRMEMTLKLGPDELLGLLWSQARVSAALNRMGESEKAAEETRVLQALPAEPIEWDFKLVSYWLEVS